MNSVRTVEEYLKLDYPFEVRKLNEEEGGGWIVTFPDFKGIIGTGDSIEEAIGDAMEAKEGWIEILIAEGKPISEPHSFVKVSGNFALRMPKSLHQWVAEAASGEGVSTNQFINHVLSMAKGKRTP